MLHTVSCRMMYTLLYYILYYNVYSKLTGRNLGQVFNFRSGHLHAADFWCYWVKMPDLNLKTVLKHFLGSFPLDYAPRLYIALYSKLSVHIMQYTILYCILYHKVNCIKPHALILYYTIDCIIQYLVLCSIFIILYTVSLWLSLVLANHNIFFLIMDFSEITQNFLFCHGSVKLT
jgi:hypothetical protein